MSEDYVALMLIPETEWKCPERSTYTVFLKFESYIYKTHFQKFTLGCNFSWIYKHKDKKKS